MSGLFGGGARETNVSNVAPVVSSLSYQTSTYGKPIPLVAGKTRVSNNLLWFGAYTPIAHTSTEPSGGSGGKGGGGGGGQPVTNTTYTYQASFALGMAAGPISGVATVWRDKDVYTAFQAGAKKIVTVTGETHTIDSAGVAAPTNASTLVGVTAVTVNGSPFTEYTFGSVGIEIWVEGGGFVPIPDGGYVVDPSTHQVRVNLAYAGQTAAISYQYTAPADPAANGALTALGMSLFTGSFSQSAWSYLTTSFPGHDYTYHGLSYVGAANSDLGTNSAIPNYSFETLGPLQYGAIAGLAKTVTANSSTDTFSSTAHGFAAGRTVRFSGASLPGGIAAGIDYTVFNPTANTFQVLLNAWDTAVVDLRTNGSGTITATPFVPDAEPSAFTNYFLTDSHHGAGFPAAKIGSLTNIAAACVAAGIFISPYYDTQEAAETILQRLSGIMNCGLVWSEGKLKFVPYWDTAVSGNGVTFTPNVTPLYDLTDDDFKPQGSDDPVIVERIDPADAYNSVTVEFRNRADQYNTATVTVYDQASIDMYGPRPMETVSLHEIVDADVAKLVAQIALARIQAIRCKYKFRLPVKYSLLEAMDPVTLTESTGTGLFRQPVRLTLTDEDEDGYINCEAEDFPQGATTGVRYPHQESLGYAANFNVTPANAVPVISIAPFSLTGVWLEAVIGLAGADANFGGAEVWAAYDTVHYQKLGTFYGESRIGQLTADLPYHLDPDNASTLAVSMVLSGGALASASAGASDDLPNLALLSTGELISFTTATLTGANAYNLTGLRRGAAGSTILPAKAGTTFLMLDKATFSYTFPLEYNDRVISLKFPAFNKNMSGLQDLASIPAYAVRLSQQYSGVPTPPNVTGLEITGQGLNTNFTGRDLKLDWRYVANNSFEFVRSPFGPNSGALDVYFKDHQVGIYQSDGTLLRTAYVTGDPHFTYTYEMNAEDTARLSLTGTPNPQRQLVAKVWQRNQFGKSSAIPDQIAVSNPAPLLLSVTLAGIAGGFSYKFTSPPDADYLGTEVHASLQSGFTPDATTLRQRLSGIANGDNQGQVQGLQPGFTYFVKFVPYDAFGAGTASAEQSVVVSLIQVSSPAGQFGQSAAGVAPTPVVTKALDGTGDVVGLGNVTSNITNIVFAPNTQALYVATKSGGNWILSAFDLRTLALVKSLDLGSDTTNDYNYRCLVYSPVTGYLYLLIQGGGIAVIDPASMTRVHANYASPGGTYAYAAACGSNGKLYLGGKGGVNVLAFDPANPTALISAFNIPTAPTVGVRGCYYHPAADDIVVIFDSTLKTLDKALVGVTATLTPTNKPYGMAYCPQDGKMWVTCSIPASTYARLKANNTLDTDVANTAPTFLGDPVYCPLNLLIYGAPSEAASPIAGVELFSSLGGYQLGFFHQGTQMMYAHDAPAASGHTSLLGYAI